MLILCWTFLHALNFSQWVSKERKWKKRRRRTRQWIDHRRERENFLLLTVHLCLSCLCLMEWFIHQGGNGKKLQLLGKIERWHIAWSVFVFFVVLHFLYLVLWTVTCLSIFFLSFSFSLFLSVRGYRATKKQLKEKKRLRKEGNRSKVESAGIYVCVLGWSERANTLHIKYESRFERNTGTKKERKFHSPSTNSTLDCFFSFYLSLSLSLSAFGEWIDDTQLLRVHLWQGKNNLETDMLLFATSWNCINFWWDWTSFFFNFYFMFFCCGYYWQVFFSSLFHPFSLSEGQFNLTKKKKSIDCDMCSQEKKEIE